MDKIEEMSVEPLTNAKFVKPFRLHYEQNGLSKTWEVVSVHPSVSVIIYNVDRKKLVFVKQFRPAVYFSTYSHTERELCLGKNEPPASGCSCVKSPPCPAHEPSTLQNDGTSELVISNNSCWENRSTQTHAGCARKALPALDGARGITLELCAGIVDKDIELRQVAQEEVLEECGYQVQLEDLEEVITYRSGVGASGDRQTLFFTEVRDVNKTGSGGGLASEGELIEVEELSIAEVRQLLQQKEVQAPSGFLFALMWFLANKAVLYE